MKKDPEILLKVMGETGMIPVFNHSDIEIAKKVLDACYSGGVRVFEFTNRSDNSPEVFGLLKAHAIKYEDLFLGIGTIMSKEEAIEFIDLRADFIVSPAFIPEVAQACKSRDSFWIPGCGTVTEIYEAKKAGASLVKAFPGNVLGPEFIVASKSVFPDLKLMPTGGVEPTFENLSGWFKAGVTCVGMGSQLFKKEWIQSGSFEKIIETTKNMLKTIESIRA